jgi:conserved oligomeric Golgi complex subunit 1
MLPLECLHAAIGTRIKYLVDTPETIWGLLEARDFLAAAHRIIGAECVHKRLAAARSQMVLTRQFKLLSHEEASSEQTRREIVAKADAVAGSSDDVHTV